MLLAGATDYILISVRTAPPVETVAGTPEASIVLVHITALAPMNDSVSIFKDGRVKPGIYMNVVSQTC